MMHYRVRVHRRFAIPPVLAVLPLVLALGGPPAPFTVTFRFGTVVIGPEPALDLVLPSVEPHGITLAGAARAGSNGPSHVTEIWITLAESPATKRIAELAHGSSDGRPVTGTCDIVVAPPSGAKPRQYLVDGCFPKSVDATGASRRVTLGYTAIKVSE